MQNRINDPGLGTRYDDKTERLINKDGTFNVVRKGGVGGVRDFYLYLITLKWIPFNLFILGYVIVVNALFAFAYLFFGIENINGIHSENFINDFLHAFYFSIQTFTSVGYGFYAPSGNSALLISSFEAIFGLITFALATGLLYGRFSRPRAKIKFSDSVLFLQHKEKPTFMIRIASMRNNVMLDMYCVVLVTLPKKSEDGTIKREYFRLNTEFDRVQFFSLSWTIVIPFDESSPFYGMSAEEIKATKAEIVVQLKGFDETFHQEIHSRSSYSMEDIKWNYKFLPCFYTNNDGSIVLELDKISDCTPV